MEVIRKDVVVIGLGAFGSAALWRLAHRGADVAGIERHGIGHQLGSSHGLTRLFRIACQEHPGLPPIALKSLELWTELGDQTGERLVRQSGCLSAGPAGSRGERGDRRRGRGRAAGLRAQPRRLVARQPQYAGLAPDDVAVWDPGAGICYPERNVRAHTAAARRAGADVYPHTMVTGIEAGRDDVAVRTPTVEFRAPQVVVAAGAWLGTLVPGLPLAPRRTPQYWFRPQDPRSEEFTLDRFPGLYLGAPRRRRAVGARIGRGLRDQDRPGERGHGRQRRLRSGADGPLHPPGHRRGHGDRSAWRRPCPALSPGRRRSSRAWSPTHPTGNSSSAGWPASPGSSWQAGTAVTVSSTRPALASSGPDRRR